MSTAEILVGALMVIGVAAAVWLVCKRRVQMADEQWRRRLQEAAEKNERALKDLEARQQTVFDSMTEGVLLLDAQGRIQFANAALKTRFGVANEIRCRTVIEALRLHEVAELVEKVRSRNQIARVELQVPGAPERWLEVNGAPIASSGGVAGAIILVCHDLTPLRQLENTRKEFVANVSHELRTPLSLIKGYVETLQDGASKDPALSEKFLATIARNAERLRLLIDDLLVISELESGGVQLNVQPLSLQRVVGRVFEDFRTRGQERGVKLVDRTGAEQVQADESRLEQVLTNLVDNALKYGVPDSEIVIGARSLDSGRVEVFVQNDGPEIPAQSLSRLFERFYRVDKGRSREKGGTGLGLAIVKHIVQNHGGKVWATSEAGRGATFHFTLARGAEKVGPGD